MKQSVRKMVVAVALEYAKDPDAMCTMTELYAALTVLAEEVRRLRNELNGTD